MSRAHRVAARILAPAVVVLGAVGCAGATVEEFTISGYRFPELAAAPGATITIVDGDDEPHTVTADDGRFDTRSFDRSAPATLVAPTEPGTYPVHCEIHPSMHGTLTVG